MEFVSAVFGLGMSVRNVHVCFNSAVCFSCSTFQFCYEEKSPIGISLAVVLTNVLTGPVTRLQAFHCTCQDLVKKGPELSENLGLSRTWQLHWVSWTHCKEKQIISCTIAGLHLIWRRLDWPVIGPVNYQTCLCNIKCHLKAVISQEIEMYKNPHRYGNRYQ